METKNRERFKPSGCQNTERCHALAALAFREDILEGLLEGRTPYPSATDITLFGPPSNLLPVKPEDEVRDELFDVRLQKTVIMEHCSGGPITTADVITVGRRVIRLPGSVSSLCPGLVNLKSREQGH